MVTQITVFRLRMLFWSCCAVPYFNINVILWTMRIINHIKHYSGFPIVPHKQEIQFLVGTRHRLISIISIPCNCWAGWGVSLLILSKIGPKRVFLGWKCCFLGEKHSFGQTISGNLSIVGNVEPEPVSQYILLFLFTKWHDYRKYFQL